MIEIWEVVLIFESVDEILWCAMHHSNDTALTELSRGTIHLVCGSTFESKKGMKSYGVTIQMKLLPQYFHMVLFIEYVIIRLKSDDEILLCDHSNETSLAVLSRGIICLTLNYKTEQGIFAEF